MVSKVRIDGHAYGEAISAPVSSCGPGIGHDSPEAYDRAAYAALSFAAADTEWAKVSVRRSSTRRRFVTS